MWFVFLSHNAFSLPELKGTIFHLKRMLIKKCQLSWGNDNVPLNSEPKDHPDYRRVADGHLKVQTVA